jgi:hypothetical protein
LGYQLRVVIRQKNRRPDTGLYVSGPYRSAGTT